MARTSKIFLTLLFLSTFGLWFGYMMFYDNWHLFKDNWFMSLTMVFGSFIAGASSEGGGAVAFPVMTLVFDIAPPVARNFSLAIQSIGMTAASILIITNKIKVELKYILPVCISGAFGIILGSLFLTQLFSPPYIKMLFVSFWLSFGVVLLYLNEVSKRTINESISNVTYKEIIILIIVGLLGGCISSLLGSGIDIFSFSFVTIRYRLSEKIATPSSVIIMASNSIVGFLFHFFVLNDFGNTEFNYWLVCIPVVIFGAPLGAYLINQKARDFISKFLYVVILVQFVGAFIILNPSGNLLLFSALVFGSGILFFSFFHWISKRKI